MMRISTSNIILFLKLLLLLLLFMLFLNFLIRDDFNLTIIQVFLYKFVCKLFYYLSGFNIS